MVSTTNVEEFRNIMLSKYELARVNTIFTTIKVQLKFGYFITCNGIPVDSTSSFYIFVRRAKCLLICLYMYRISRCIGLHDTKIKLKKNHQNLNHQIILKKKKISSIFVKLPVHSKYNRMPDPTERPYCKI